MEEMTLLGLKVSDVRFEVGHDQTCSPRLSPLTFWSLVILSETTS